MRAWSAVRASLKNPRTPSVSLHLTPAFSIQSLGSVRTETPSCESLSVCFRLATSGDSDCCHGDLPYSIRTEQRSVLCALVHQAFTPSRLPSVKDKDSKTETRIPFSTMQVQILGQHGENESGHGCDFRSNGDSGSVVNSACSSLDMQCPPKELGPQLEYLCF